ncbi:MAG: C_GCAxxG_C_C family protein [Spirochaetes bacterium]|nr:C_GCAxxG_C_C family protein [Spirochaetota bacterium]
MSNESELALDVFDDGLCCAQAVLAAFAEQFSLDRETALRIASGFGAGMGRMTNVCGAATGAYMVLGLKYGYTVFNKEVKENAYAMVREFSRRFRERNNGNLLCRELLGCDISTPEGHAYAKEHDVVTKVCPKAVEDAALILTEMLEEAAKNGK